MISKATFLFIWFATLFTFVLGYLIGRYEYILMNLIDTFATGVAC